MVEHTVSVEDLHTIHLNEQELVASVTQNVAMVLATLIGSATFYRDFGIDMSFLDTPTPEAEIRMRAPIREAIERWEPRATVKEIAFTRCGASGRLNPHVTIEIHAQERR